MKNPKYIFIVGGVMSGVGKGVAAASIAKILQSKGYEVTAIKIDPYVNIDAGTMNPTEHGEVFVLDDGMECDQDMGNYERFLNRNLSGANYMTTGSVYLSLINKERSLEFGGKCVEVVPHIPLEVINRINNAAKKEKAEIVVIEIGGTVGEYQNILFLESVRMLKIKNHNDVALTMVSYLPLQGDGGELKTKPTQYAVRTLNSAGLQPDIVIARANVSLDLKRKDKIAFNCNIAKEAVISAPDVNSIYEVPVNFEKDKLSRILLKTLNLKARKKDLREWKKLAKTVRTAKKTVKIGIVGKYFSTGNFVLADSYISVIEAVKHAIYSLKLKPEIHWLNSGDFDPKEITQLKIKENLKTLKNYDGVIIPGGFGSRGVEGKIETIKYLRQNKIPFLGLCYGMQLAVIEFARNVAGMKGAHTTEVDQKTKYPVIDILPEQRKNLAEKNYGATMRLGAYPAIIKSNTIAHKVYNNTNFQIKNKKELNTGRLPAGDFLISERHRHRFEVNPKHIKKLESKGLIFSGVSPDKRLMEILELPKNKHPFFVATQFHPEFKSRPLYPHPLFKEFIKSANKK
ncbi:MAG: CTP synthase (glutamine hydrolyzing) [Patescibacteria group bacterium]|nr:CTP synthase (glutamine hydrolyzing) [Patescibacteria group bacterium]